MFFEAVLEVMALATHVTTVRRFQVRLVASDRTKKRVQMKQKHAKYLYTKTKAASNRYFNIRNVIQSIELR